MTLKYTNNLDDWIEFHYFLDTIKKNRIFYFKFRKIVLYACYLYCLCTILYFLSLIYKSSFDIKVIGDVVIGTLVVIILVILLNIIIKLEPKFYLSRINKAYKLAIEKKPNLVKEKVGSLKPDRFVVAVDNSETEIHFESIFKIFENNDKVYVLNKKYKALLIIPCEAFKNNDEKLDFLSKIKK